MTDSLLPSEGHSLLNSDEGPVSTTGLPVTIAYGTEMQATHAEQAEHLEKRRINQQAPISRLSPELFSNIICDVRDSILRPAPAMWAWQRTKDCIGLTHVCHAWRDVVINTPTLWATIFITSEDRLEWVQEMLRRSKQCLLSVLFKSPKSAPSAVGLIMNGLKSDMHRFRELWLLDIPIDNLHDFFSNSHTHRLEYLHIIPFDTSSDTSSDDTSDNTSNASSDTNSDTSDIPSDTSSSDISSDAPSSDTSSAARFTLSDNFLRADSLRRLSIEDCGLDFHAAFLRFLTHLELVNIDEDCRLPCIEFITVLVAIPGLEQLKLEGFLKEDEVAVENLAEYVAVTNKTHLNIKYLNLSCSLLQDMIPFLCALILPPSCKLRLWITHEGPEIAPGFPLITSWLSRHFQSVPSFHLFQNCFRSWYLEDTSYVTADLRVKGFCDSELEESHVGDFDEALLSASVLLSYDSESESDRDFVNSSWQSFLKSLPLSNTVSLEVMDLSAMPHTIWAGIFCPLITLKTIIIDSKYYAPFFRLASPRSNNSIAPPFPAVSSVTVKAKCVEDYLSIVNSLDSRREAGLAPFKLVFYTDDITPHAITQLRKCALDVQVHPF